MPHRSLSTETPPTAVRGWFRAVFPHPCIGWCAWLVLTAMVVHADEGTVDLRRTAGPDSALAVEVGGLPELYKGLRASKWFEQVSGSALFQRWRGSPGYEGLAKTLAEIERRLDRPLTEVVEGLARHRLMFVLEPAAEGAAPGWLLAGHGSGEARVAELVALWNRLEQARTVSRTADGFSWTERQVGSGANGLLVYVVRGGHWWLSNREFLLRRAVTASAGDVPATTGEGVFDWSAEFDRLPRNAHVRCVLRARAWDELLRIEEGLVSGDFGDRFAAEWWRGTECVSCALGFDPDGAQHGPNVELRASWPKASAKWEALCRRSVGGASFLERVPSDALLTVSARVQPLAGWNWLPIPDDENSRRELGKLRSVVMGLCFGLDPFDDILAGLEANWGVSLVPLRSGVPGRWPLALVAVWELPGEGRADWDAARRALLGRGLANAVRTGLTIWSVAHNDKQPDRPTRLRAEPAREGEPTGELVWLDGLTEGEPAYAIGERYFGLGTSPGALKAFLDTSAARRGWRGGEWMPDDAAASRNVMAHVAAKRLRSWLTENKASLAEAVARWQKVDAKGVVKRLDRLSEGLELADDLVLGAKFEEGELVISGAWSSGGE